MTRERAANPKALRALGEVIRATRSKRGYAQERFAAHAGIDRGYSGAVKRGEHRLPCCEHGEWRFAGADRKRGATKWCCPPGSASPRPCGSRMIGCIR